MKLLEFLTRKNWIKYQYVTDKAYIECSPGNLKAKRFCLLGAIDHIYPDKKEEIYQKIINSIRNYKKRPHRKMDTESERLEIARFNDSSFTNFPDVQAVIKEAGV